MHSSSFRCECECDLSVLNQQNVLLGCLVWFSFMLHKIKGMKIREADELSVTQYNDVVVLPDEMSVVCVP